MTQYTVTVEPLGVSFPAHAGERILAAAHRAGIDLPHECGWGTCGTCKVVVLEGHTELLFPDAPAFSERDARRNRILACQCAATSDLTIRINNIEPVSIRPRRIDATLVERIELAPSLYRTTFRADEPVEYHAGQFAVVEFPSGVRRCYSMSQPAAGHDLEFIFKDYSTSGSKEFAGLEPGAKVTMELPFGAMRLVEGDDDVVLIAGGTGVSAMKALLTHAASEGSFAKVTLLYGARSEAELVELEALRDQLALIENATLRTITDEAGYVSDLLDETTCPPDHSRVYLAGPPAMVDAAMARLRELGVPITKIHVDRFG